MMDLPILPFQAMGSIRLGSTRQETRTLLGDEFQPLRKVGNTNPIDAYKHLGLHLHFDDDDRLEFLEAFPPSLPTWHSLELLGRHVHEVRDDLLRQNVPSILETDGLRSDQIGIVLYAPVLRVDAVSIYRRGYYD